MTYSRSQALDVLARTPAALRALLIGLPEELTHQASEGGDSWSPFDVVGHLIHGEHTDWIPRAHHILDIGPEVPFEPFDRFAQNETSRGKTMDDLLNEFAEARERSLAAFRELELTPERLAQEGTHPELGPVTMSELLTTWVVHDLGHIAQIARVLAKTHGDGVGPWRAYLPVLAPRTGS